MKHDHDMDSIVSKAQQETISERKARGKGAMVKMMKVPHPSLGEIEYPIVEGVKNSINHTYTSKFKGELGKYMRRDVRLSITTDKNGKPTVDSYSINEDLDWDTNPKSRRAN